MGEGNEDQYIVASLKLLRWPWQEKFAERECRWDIETTTSRERDRYLIELLQHSKMKVKLSSIEPKSKKQKRKNGETSWDESENVKIKIRQRQFSRLRDGHSILDGEHNNLEKGEKSTDKVEWGAEEDFSSSYASFPGF